MSKLRKKLFFNPKAQRVILCWIVYRGIKILALYLIFREHPIIWIPTVITTTIIFYFNIRAKKNKVFDEESKNDLGKV